MQVPLWVVLLRGAMLAVAVRQVAPVVRSLGAAAAILPPLARPARGGGGESRR